MLACAGNGDSGGEQLTVGWIMGGDMEEDDVGGAGEEVVHDPLHGQLAVPVPVDGHHDGRRRLVQERRRRRHPVLVGALWASLHRANVRRSDRDGRRRLGRSVGSCDGCVGGWGAGEEGRQRGGRRRLVPPLLSCLSSSLPCLQPVSATALLPSSLYISHLNAMAQEQG